MDQGVSLPAVKESGGVMNNVTNKIFKELSI